MGRWSTRLAVLVGVLLAAGIVALGGFGGILYWNRVELVGAQQTRTELPQLAATQVPMILSYDYNTIERSRIQVYDLLAPDFRREYENTTTTNTIPQAKSRQTISQVNVVGVGMLDARRNSGSVMVFTNRTITDKSKQPLYEGSRLRVDYQRLDGAWRITAITLL